MNAQKHTCDCCGKESADSKKENGWIRVVSGGVFNVFFSSGGKGVTQKKATGPLDLCSKECVEKFFTAPPATVAVKKVEAVKK